MSNIYLIPPTLKSMSLNTISLELWKQPDIVSELKSLFDSSDRNFYSYQKSKKWFKIRERVVEKISGLSLPELLKEKANEAIDLIGLRMSLWFEKVVDLLPRNNIPDYIRLISLNSDGEIDRKMTTRSILNAFPNTDPYLLYCFACFNCLEDEIHRLWKTLSVEERNILVGIKSGFVRGHDADDLVIYWSCSISQDFNYLLTRIARFPRRRDNINDYFIWYSMRHWNYVAFKYFWEKLSEEEKGKNIVKYAIELSEWIYIEFRNKLFKLVGDSVEICYLLGSQMSEVQLIEMVQQDAYRAMQFWCWCQYSHEGLISLDSLWNFICPSRYRQFFFAFLSLRIIRPNDSRVFVREDRRIFKELWENTPNNIKRGFFENVLEIEHILYSFIMTVDVENLQLIFDDATVKQRKKIINHSFSREDFFVILEEYYSLHRTDEDNRELRFLTDKDVDDFLHDVLSSFKGKQVKDELWPLLNKLNKFKTRTSS